MIMSKKLPDLAGEHFRRWAVLEYVYMIETRDSGAK